LRSQDEILEHTNNKKKVGKKGKYLRAGIIKYFNLSKVISCSDDGASIVSIRVVDITACDTNI
jgi:hypothetical protein